VLELRDKLEGFGVEPAKVATVLPVEEDVLSALVNLGYQRAAAEKALATVKRNGTPEFDALFRGALGALSR
jgi:holliday junction DNA helicase RuvA